MIWEKDLLLNKASYFIERAEELDNDDPIRPLFYSFSLELICKAGLSNIHPTLVADPQKEGANILYALGFNNTSQPRSITAQAIFKRLAIVLESFLDIHVSFCEYFSNLRNEELHTGGSPMGSISEKDWLPRFYEVINIVCKSMDHELSYIIGTDNEKFALDLINKLDKDEEKKLKEKINSHRLVYSEKSIEEKEQANEQAKVFLKGISFYNRIKEKCPSCGNYGILQGNRIQEKEPRYDGSDFLSEVVYQATNFSCKFCGLELKNQKEVSSSDLKIRFIKREILDLHDFFQPEYEDDYMNM